MMARRVRTAGFTLVELLVVIGIIAILMAIAFPVFKGAQEKGNQTACIARLQQIGQAVKMYRLDKGTYPSSLTDLSEFMSLSVSGGKWTHGKDKVMCKDDSTLGETYIGTSLPYSSYYADDLTKINTSIVWNYYGLKQKKKSDGTLDLSPDPDRSYAYTADDAEYLTVMGDLDNSGTVGDVGDYRKHPRLYNRFAPDYTIITHCTFHRTKTGNNVNQQLEVVLRVDGTAKTLQWKSYDWIAQPS